MGRQDALLPRKREEAATVAGFALGWGASALCQRTYGRGAGSLQAIKGVWL